MKTWEDLERLPKPPETVMRALVLDMKQNAVSLSEELGMTEVECQVGVLVSAIAEIWWQLTRQQSEIKNLRKKKT